MPNLRVVNNNAVNRTSAFSASTTAGSLAASNLRTDIKTEVWRSTGTTASLTATWGPNETVAMAALAFSNLSATATMRVQCYTVFTDPTAAYDSGHVLCCPASLGFTAPWVTAGANSFAYGGGVYAAVWFPAISAQKVVITITDSSNPSGYVEAARLIIGNYWSPDRNAETDTVTITPSDDSKHYRSEAGSLWTDRGPMFKRLAFDLNYMTANDRTNLWKVVRANGMSTSLYISMVPESTDATDEQIYTIYGRLSQSSAIQYKYSHLYASKFQVDEI